MELRLHCDTDVTVIIPTYNMEEDLFECLTSLRQQTYQKFTTIIVVDESGDGTKDMLINNFPQVKIIHNQNRIGIEASRNIAIKNSQSKYIVFLDADTKLTPNWIEGMLKHIEEQRSVGMYSCKILDFYQPDLIDNVGHDLYYDFSPIHIGQGQRDIGQLDKQNEVFGICMAGCLIKRDVFDTIGYFDEDYIRFFDEWTLRARMAGYKCYCVPSAIMYHKGRTTNSRNRRNIFLWERNRILSIIKHYPFYMFLYSIYYTLRRYVSSIVQRKDKVPLYYVVPTVIQAWLETLKLLPTFLRKRYIYITYNTAQRNCIESYLRRRWPRV